MRNSGLLHSRDSRGNDCFHRNFFGLPWGLLEETGLTMTSVTLSLLPREGERFQVDPSFPTRLIQMLFRLSGHLDGRFVKEKSESACD